MNTRGSRIAFAFVAAFATLVLAACSPAGGGGVQSGEPRGAEGFASAELGNGWAPSGSVELEYATQFAIDDFEGGYRLLRIANGERYLVVPEGAEAPGGIADDIVLVQQPVGDIYLVASDAGCLFAALDALDAISVSGISQDNWRVPALASAMESGAIAYGGKYSMPDYDTLLAAGVGLSIQSTMINHTPDVREKLIELGIPVMIEQSSLEDEPLGRAEWVKFYGALLGKSELADALFEQQAAKANAVKGADTGKTVAFFYINSNGAAVVRKPGDYVTRMIELAGGHYIFASLDDDGTARSTVTMEMERFYAEAKDADVIVYNSTIDSGVNSLADLVAKNELLGKFKAVEEGEVWVTEQNMYQEMLAAGDIVSDFNAALTGASGDLDYLHKLS